jgi:hypothetical protein
MGVYNCIAGKTRPIFVESDAFVYTLGGPLLLFVGSQRFCINRPICGYSDDCRDIIVGGPCVVCH